MRFTIAKPSNRMSFGDLFFTRPDFGDCAIRFKDFEAYCKKRAAEEFGNNTIMLAQLEKELDMIDQTGSTIMVEIIAEIAKLSNESGYPVCLFGPESGLIVMYLLGISGIHPRQYEFSTVPSKLALNSVLDSNYFSVTLAIAEPVREQILPRLDKEFGDIDCGNEDYNRIFLPASDAIKEIGELSRKTGYSYSEINLENSQLLADVVNYICKEDLGWDNAENLSPVHPVDAARYYAFARCNAKDEKCHSLFSDVKNRVLRDTVYEELVELGFKDYEAYDMSKLRIRSPHRQQEIEKLTDMEAQPNLIYVFKELENLWSLAPCLSRINAMAMLRSYKHLDSELYNQIVKE